VNRNGQAPYDIDELYKQAKSVINPRRFLKTPKLAALVLRC